jgi:hypothetical protein
MGMMIDKSLLKNFLILFIYLFIKGNSSTTSLVLPGNGKPLRSERLPAAAVEEMVRQAKIRRRNGGKKEVCVFCRNNGEREVIFTSHTLKDSSNTIVACPILRLYPCPICQASGDYAHTIRYCPYADKESSSRPKLNNGRINAFFTESLGGDNSPQSSPPTTPTPIAQLANGSFSQFQNQQMNNNNNQQSSFSPTFSSPNGSSSAISQLNGLNFNSLNLTSSSSGRTNNNNINQAYNLQNLTPNSDISSRLSLLSNNNLNQFSGLSNSNSLAASAINWSTNATTTSSNNSLLSSNFQK